MKNLLLLLFFAIVVIGCSEVNTNLTEDSTELDVLCDFMSDTLFTERGSVLSESQDRFYYEVWKSELINQNEIELSYFNKHFKKINITSSKWNGGITFQIDYLFTFDWLKFKVKDEFMVKLNSSWSTYRHLKIPRDTLLNDEWTRYNIRNNIYHTGTCKINRIESLLYNSCKEAYQSFKDSSGYEMIYPQSISLYVPGKVPRIDGYPYFIGYGLIDSTSFKCVKGYFNIVNGTFKVWEDYCGPKY
jgi:hypothetical protein